MVTHLQFSKIHCVDRAGALMLVWFLDSQGNMFDWAPTWNDADQIYRKQVNVERFNKPEGAWLNKFAKTAQSVVEGAQRIERAYEWQGTFCKCEAGKLVITGNEETRALTPGFEITMKFLNSWLDRLVQALIVNDFVFRLTSLGGQWRDVYPEEVESPTGT